ncbi:MAG: hypothetical protein IKM84_05925 [Oscillospiraceae bacterium]|nr:hypothetical protein [Oscillospiraceae bacterium]
METNAAGPGVECRLFKTGDFSQKGRKYWPFQAVPTVQNPVENVDNFGDTTVASALFFRSGPGTPPENPVASGGRGEVLRDSLVKKSS